MPRAHIVLADDHDLFREGLAGLINAQPDMETVGQAGDGLEALEVLDGVIALLDRIVPDDSEHHFNALAMRAETLEDLGRTDEAREAARAAIKHERQRGLISPERWQHLEALAR